MNGPLESILMIKMMPYLICIIYAIIVNGLIEITNESQGGIHNDIYNS